MKKYRFLVLAFLITISFTNCEDDELTETTTENPDVGQNPDPAPTTFNYDFGNDVSRNFIGRIINENKQPLAHASITIGSATTQTDINGMFVMENVTVKENFAYIKASLSGYFNGSRSVIPIDGENRVDIMLKEKFSVVKESGAPFTLQDGFSIIEFSGDFVKEDGTPYSGTVTIAFNYLSPSDENLNDLMPGMLLGQDTEGEANILETYGMLTAELTGSNNEKLQIASDSELKFPIAYDQLNSAPSTIPLWYFDEENGYWVQDGEATRVEDQYVGTVSHFTPWNVDVPLPMAKIDLTILNQNNVSLLGIDVHAYSPAEYFPRRFTTNKDGKICGFVPANQPITLEVIGLCGEALSSVNIGPFVENSTNVIPPIIITEMMATIVEVTGTLQQCDNSNVTNGYVIFDNSEQEPVFYSVTNGNFDFNTFICNGATTFTLEGFDYDNSQNTGENTYTFTPPTTDVGNLMTCNDVDEYVIYTLFQTDGSITTIKSAYAPFEVTIEPNRLFIEKNDLDFIMDFNPSDGEQFSDIGTYEIDTDFYFRHNIGQPPYVEWRAFIGYPFVVITNEMTINILEFGEVGEYITFTFEGEHVNIYDQEFGFGQTVTNGTVRVRRDQ